MWFYQGIDLPYPCLKASRDWEGGLKTSSPAPLFLLTANKRLPSFTETAHCERKEAMASQDPPLKNAAPLKACSSPHRWHDRFPAWPISWNIFTTEAQYWETSEPRRSVLVWMKWLQLNYYCYLLLFDQMLLFFMPDILSICVKTGKKLFLPSILPRYLGFATEIVKSAQFFQMQYTLRLPL